MIPRMTTIGVLNNYRYDLNKSNNTMTKAMNTVMTGRSFNSYAEDPALATRCFQIRRSFLRTASQLDVNTSLVSKYNQAWSCLDTVSQDIYDSTVTQNSTAFGSILRSENDPDASGRNPLGQSLAALARDIVQTMNGRNGENYIFAGADTLNAPFTWQTRENGAYIDPETADPTNPDHAAAFKYLVDPAKVADPNVDVQNPDGTWPDGKLAPGTLYTNDEEYAAYTPVENILYPLTYDTENVDETEVLKAIWKDMNGVSDEETEPTEEELAAIKDQLDNGEIHGKYLTEKSETRVVYVENKDGTTSQVTYYTNTTNEADGDPAPKQAIQKNDESKDPDIYPGAAYDPETQYKYLKSDGRGTNREYEAAQDLYFRGVRVDSNDPNDVRKMEYFLSEAKYLDVGLGHKELNEDPLSSTVFNSALQGIYYLGGFGVKEKVEVTTGSGKTVEVENVPNNMINIISELGAILQRCDPNNGAYASEEDEARAIALAQQFETQQDVFTQRYAEIDTKTSFLRDNGELLTDTADSLSQQFMALEDVDPADAITAYMYARYCYDAALKLGNSVLPQSLMDYMNL